MVRASVPEVPGKSVSVSQVFGSQEGPRFESWYLRAVSSCLIYTVSVAAVYFCKEYAHIRNICLVQVDIWVNIVYLIQICYRILYILFSNRGLANIPCPGLALISLKCESCVNIDPIPYTGTVGLRKGNAKFFVL